MDGCDSSGYNTAATTAQSGLFKLRRPRVEQTLLTRKLPATFLPTPIRDSSAEETQSTMSDKRVQPLRNFVKRFSLRPTPTQSEPEVRKQRVSMISTWRRRRSSVQKERDRSPLKACHNLQCGIGTYAAPETNRIKIAFRDLRRRSNLLNPALKASLQDSEDSICNRLPSLSVEPLGTNASTETPSRESPNVSGSNDKLAKPSNVPTTMGFDTRASAHRTSLNPETSRIVDRDRSSCASFHSRQQRRLAYNVNSNEIELVRSTPTSVSIGRSKSNEFWYVERRCTDSISKSTSQDSGWSSGISSLYQAAESNGSDLDGSQSVDCSTPSDISPVAIGWNNRLRKSLDRAKRRCHLSVGLTLFNKDPQEGINYMVERGILLSFPSTIARFLFNQGGLSRQAIGDYFGLLKNPMSSQVLQEYLLLIDMRNMEVDQAVRAMLSRFHPSGESQKITHLMQVFQTVYVEQNAARVAETFRSVDTVEILAYSILMLHTDLHNPNVRRLGHRMTAAEFVSNNKAMDAGGDLPVGLLRGIYRRIADREFKPLPDPTDRLRRLDSMLSGSLKTDNFLQRHRRFLGWVISQQYVKIPTKRLNHRKRWRHVLVFNDLLVVTKQIFSPLGGSGSLWNLAASTASGGDSSAVLSQKSPEKCQYFSEEPMASGNYRVHLVLPIKDLRILVFETQHSRYGVCLCNAEGLVFNFGLPTSQARQKFIDWVHSSMAEINELQDYYQRGHEKDNASSTTVQQQTNMLIESEEEAEEEEVEREETDEEVVTRL